MSFRDQLADYMKAEGVTAACVDQCADGPTGQAVCVSQGDESVIVPCRTNHAPDAPQHALLHAVLIACQNFNGCDDFLDWAEIYGLDAGDNQAWHDFRDFDAAQWRLKDLIGSGVFDGFLIAMETDQAVSAARTSYQRSS